MQQLSYEMTLAAAQVARKVADEYTTSNPDKPRFVAGALGPTNKTASLSPDVNNPAYRAITFDELVDSYYIQVDALMDGEVDIILVETILAMNPTQQICSGSSLYASSSLIVG